jgi:hypothetical protein
MRNPRHKQQIERELDPIFRKQRPWQTPIDLHLLVLESAARDLVRIAEIDLRACRARCAESEPAQLQPGRHGRRALLDLIEGEGFGLFVLRVFEDFEPIDDRTGRTDQVVTHRERSRAERSRGSRVAALDIQCVSGVDGVAGGYRPLGGRAKGGVV